MKKPNNVINENTFFITIFQAISMLTIPYWKKKHLKLFKIYFTQIK